MDLKRFSGTKANLLCIFSVIISMAFQIMKILSYNSNVFCDENDIITASWMMSEGCVLYKDIFSHHAPFPYYFLSVFDYIGVYGATALRLCVFGLFFLILTLLMKQFQKEIPPVIFSVAIGIITVIKCPFCGNLILAESFYSISVLVLLALVYTRPHFDFSYFEMIEISLATFIAIMSTFFAVYPFLFFYLTYICIRVKKYIKQKDIKLFVKDLKFFLIVLAPFLILLLMMLLNGSLTDFIDNAYFFNSKYYNLYTNEGNNILSVIIYGLVGYTKHFKHTLCFIFLLLILAAVKYFKRSFNLMWTAVFALLVLLRHRDYFELLPGCYMIGFYLSLLLYEFLISEKCRSIILTIKNNSITARASSLVKNTINRFCTFAKKQRYLNFLAKHMYLLLVLIIGISFTLTVGLNNNKFDDTKTYDVIRSLTDEDDKIWCAHLSPEIYYYAERMPCNKNIFYLPWQSIVPGNNENVVDDIKKYDVKVVFFQDGTIWQDYKTYDYAATIKNYLDENYFKIEELNKSLYFSNKYKDDIMNKLEEKDFY